MTTIGKATETKRPEIKPYTGLNVGTIGNNTIIAGAKAGVSVTSTENGLHADASGTFGTGYKLESAIGYNVNFGNNIGLDLGVKAQQAKSFVGSNKSITWGDEKLDANLKETRIGANATLNYSNSHVSFGIGCEAGYKNCEKYNLNGIVDYGTSFSTIVDDKIVSQDVFVKLPVSQTVDFSRPYITPTFEGKVNINEKLSLNVNADLYQANIGLNYLF